MTGMHEYIQKLIKQDLVLLQKIEQLEHKLVQMQQQLDELKLRQPWNIENIHYRFDQLKIEQLDGTLNIGLTPELSQGIEGDVLQQKQIFDSLDVHLKTEASQFIAEYAQQQGLELSDEYMKQMLDHVRDQLNERIAHYVRLGKLEDRDLSELTQQVVAQVKVDITKSLKQHLDTLKQQGE